MIYKAKTCSIANCTYRTGTQKVEQSEGKHLQNKCWQAQKNKLTSHPVMLKTKTHKNTENK